jgi:hypothetical protein
MYFCSHESGQRDRNTTAQRTTAGTEKQVCHQWDFAVCIFYNIYYLRCIRGKCTVGKLEHIILDHYPFCFGECRVEKFYPGE